MIEVVLCPRDNQGNKKLGKKARLIAKDPKEIGKMAEEHVGGRKVKKAYRADSIDRFFGEGVYAPQP